MSDKDIEQQIQAKGLTAPRVTLSISSVIKEHYFTSKRFRRAANKSAMAIAAQR
jgi:hypothetical protein